MDKLAEGASSRRSSRRAPDAVSFCGKGLPCGADAVVEASTHFMGTRMQPLSTGRETGSVEMALEVQKVRDVVLRAV